MTFSLSVSPEFFYGTDSVELIEHSDRPSSVLQAIISLSADQRQKIAREVFECESAVLSDDLILHRVLKTDTCTDLTPPVEVWIDQDGIHTLHVFD